MKKFSRPGLLFIAVVLFSLFAAPTVTGAVCKERGSVYDSARVSVQYGYSYKLQSSLHSSERYSPYADTCRYDDDQTYGDICDTEEALRIRVRNQPIRHHAALLNISSGMVASMMVRRNSNEYSSFPPEMADITNIRKIE